ncbi:hypothetical protein BG004_006757 [Podila humilis]|nr:hypothetical protein BG004_006757 [Podila humilis]
MNEYQTFELNGEQELVQASYDEEGLPCVFLHSINRVFPNTRSVSSYGVHVPFSTDRWGQQRMPLRIPFFENRVLEVVLGDSSLEWSREATATRIAAAVAAGLSYNSSNTQLNTVHTDPLPGVLSDNDEALLSDDDCSDDVSIDMIESDVSSDGEDEDDEQEDSDGQDNLEPGPWDPTQHHGIVHSLERITLRPPPFNTHINEDTGADFAYLPSYALEDNRTIRVNTQNEHVVNVVPTVLDDPSERHLVHSRIEFIRRISKKIVLESYSSAECAHPPLFIILPENPLQWSPNILHNKMRLHFLCDRCMHDVSIDTGSSTSGSTDQRNIHVAQGSGFEIRLDQYLDQQLFTKFGHYILSLLRMLQYGVIFEGFFVAAAFDRIVPPLMSGATVAGKMDIQLFYKFKQNVERSIAFMDALLGDDYEEEQAEAVSRLDSNDFRLLDEIIKRRPYVSAYHQFSESISTLDYDRDPSLTDGYQGGSGLYKIESTPSNARWGCDKAYESRYQTLDMVFSERLKLLQATLKTDTRAAIIKATSEHAFTTRVISVSKIKSLCRIDMTLDWAFEKDHLADVVEVLRTDSTSVSSIAIRLGKKVRSIVWNNSDQKIDGIIHLLKHQRIKHAILEGDVDLTSIPNIGTMDFSNLDILCMIKTNNRPAPPQSLAGGSIPPFVPPTGTSKAWTQDIYIPRLASLLQSCGFLVELTLGFPDVVPGHIRILQTCLAGLTRLKRLDLFRVLTGTSTIGASGAVARRLELSANFIASHTARLYLSECKTLGEGKLLLAESLEELLLDEGAYIEDLEFRFIGFNDKHAHALEFGTRRVNGRHSCRLRRLVIHGNGLESRGAAALRRVLKRATLFLRMDDFENRAQSSHSNFPAPIPASSNDVNEGLTFGNLLALPTLTHLELCSVDSLDDMDWARLLSDLNPRRLTTLNLQGIGFGDNAMEMLANGHNQESDAMTTSSPASPRPTHVTVAPPAFFSTSAPLEVQTLRLSCSTLSQNGVVNFQEFVSRLIHISTLSFHGFRKVTPENWRDILGRIEFRWIEAIEIVSSGFDDGCALYLGERLQAREQTVQAPAIENEESELLLPAYVERCESTIPTTHSSLAATPSTAAPTSARRDSLSSRLFSMGNNGSSVSSTSALSLKSSSKDDKGDKKEKPVEKQLPARPKPNPSQKYLEIDLRYTDVSTKCLLELRRALYGLAKKVVVMCDEEEEEDRYDSGQDNSGNLVPPMSSKLSEERARQNQQGGTSSSSSVSSLVSPMARNERLASQSNGTATSLHRHQDGHQDGHHRGRQQGQQQNQRSKFSTLRNAFSRK